LALKWRRSDGVPTLLTVAPSFKRAIACASPDHSTTDHTWNKRYGGRSGGRSTWQPACAKRVCLSNRFRLSVWAKCEVAKCPLFRRFQGISRPDADTLESTRAGRHSVKLKGRPRNDGNTTQRASLRLMNDWSLGWNRAHNISRELELSLYFPADLWLNRYKPAAHSGWLQVRVLPPPPTSPNLVRIFEVPANSKLFFCDLPASSIGCETHRNAFGEDKFGLCLTCRFRRPIRSDSSGMAGYE
jgi:hypothetical protein